MEWYWWVLIIIIVVSVFNYYKTKWKRERLMEKYGDKEIVDMIMKQNFWQGQSKEQLIDSLGQPLDIDQRVLKTKIKETWKYNKTGKNRYGLKVIIENGEVIGWDKK